MIVLHLQQEWNEIMLLLSQPFRVVSVWVVGCRPHISLLKWSPSETYSWYMNSLCDIGVCLHCTFESTSSCTTVLVVSRTRTVCKSFSSSKPFSISCHNMLMMFPAAACHAHTNTFMFTSIFNKTLHIITISERTAWGHTASGLRQSQNTDMWDQLMLLASGSQQQQEFNKTKSKCQSISCHLKLTVSDSVCSSLGQKYDDYLCNPSELNNFLLTF